nr:hypothetical protein [Tanacetum cinerariifolium]
SGLNWLFDIDSLTKSMNYVPVVDADTRNTDAPESSGNSNPTATLTNPPADQLETLTVETSIPTFEDILGVTSNSEESNRVEADVSYMETSITASLIPTLRIHRDHPKSQIIGPVDTLVQTKNKSKEISDALQDPSWVEAMQEELLQFKIQKMDVKSAFLYETIDEEVNVMQPPGFQDPEYPARVYKVEKAMYGLHQAPRAWYVYVGDIIFGSSNPQLCKEFEALMHEKFQMSAMGKLNFFLGLQVLQKEDGIFLSQDKYVGDILKKFGYSDVKSSNTPMDKENPWGKDGTGKDVDLHLYRSMIGSLMYLTASKPDIMFAICACARHQVTPKECHLHAVKRIFRYLKGHPKLELWYPKDSPFDLVAFSDSDYGGAT